MRSRLAGAAALGLALLGSTVATSPAHAAGAAFQPDFTTLTITKTSPGDPDMISVGNTVELAATFEITAGSAEPTDYFSLEVPTPPLRIVSTSFRLDDTAGGPPLALCTAASASLGVTAITCTLTEDADPTRDIHGELYFAATVNQASADSTLTFILGGEPFAADVPGGQIYDRQPLPDPMAPPSVARKQGAASTATRIQWALRFPGSALPDNSSGSAAVLTDSLEWTGATVLLNEALDVYAIPNDDYRGNLGRAREYYAESGYRLRDGEDYSVDPTSGGFTLTFDDAIASEKDAFFFLVRYYSDNPIAGSGVVTNSTTGLTTGPITASVALLAGGSGSHSAQPIANLSWTKTDGSALLGGASFLVTSASGPSISVSDNDSNDLDPSEGTIRIAVPAGDYTIAEAAAPDGYTITDQTLTAVVTTQQAVDNATVDAGSLINTLASTGPDKDKGKGKGKDSGKGKNSSKGTDSGKDKNSSKGKDSGKGGSSGKGGYGKSSVEAAAAELALDDVFPLDEDVQ